MELTPRLKCIQLMNTVSEIYSCYTHHRLAYIDRYFEILAETLGKQFEYKSHSITSWQLIRLSAEYVEHHKKELGL